MILGVSNLVITTNEDLIEEKLLLIESLEYKKIFVEKNLKNNDEKSTFLKNENPFHDMYFFKHERRFAIELVVYKEVSFDVNPIILSFSKKIHQDDAQCDNILNKAIYFNKLLNILYFISRDNTLIFQVSENLAKECEFWQALNYKCVNNIIQIKSLLPQWKADIILNEQSSEYALMDSSGVNTLCLLTNNIEKDSCKVVNDHSNMFNMKINNKITKNFLIKGISYNVELVGIENE